MEAVAAARYDRRPMLLAAVAVVVLLVVGAADCLITAGQVPDVPAACEPLTDVCNDARNAAFRERLDRTSALEDDLTLRTWAYAALALLAALGGVAAGWRRNPTRGREVFTDLGVGAVLWLLAALGLYLILADRFLNPPSKPLVYTPLALLVVAGIGTLLTRGEKTKVESHARPAADRDPTAGAAVRWIGYGATALSIVLGVAGGADRPDPCSEAGLPDDGVNVLIGISGLFAAVAVACGIASLFQRRWVGALVMLAGAPFVFAFILATGSCWN